MCTPPERSSALPPNTLRVTHWTPKNSGGSDLVPEADFQGRREPRMLTTDISLREGPIYREISLRFFVNLLDLDTTWAPLDERSTLFQATSDKTGEDTWTGTRADLVFGSNSELRVLAKVYASDDAAAAEKFVHDFVRAWTKVTNLDRFDAS